MTENRAHHRDVGHLIRSVQGYSGIDALLDELLLEIFDFTMWMLGDWETLVQVCQRWRSIVLSAPRRLRLQLVCTSRTPVRERLNIWPKLPIVLRVLSDFDEINYHVIAALENRHRIYEIYIEYISNDGWESLMESMEVSFPALTSLYLDSIGDAAFPNLFWVDPPRIYNQSA